MSIPLVEVLANSTPQRPAGAVRPRTPSAIVVLGAHYGALGVVRSLGRKGISTVVVKCGEHNIAAFSRYASQVFDFPRKENGYEFLTNLAAQHNLSGSLLIPTTDDTVAMVSRASEHLSRDYVVITPPWSTMKQLCDKRSLYELAGALGIDHPSTMYPAGVEGLENFNLKFPVILKPAHREITNPLTRAKAWQVNNARELMARYKLACEFMPAELIMIQEVIPGGGEAQFSYAALCLNGKVLASLTARRTRQFPIDYGRSSTYVETIAADPKLEEAAARLLAAVRMTGLVEVEFKRDTRGSYKLLDVNPRVWTWHALGSRAGVDFPYLLWLLASGNNFCAPKAREGVTWRHFFSDLPAAVAELYRGKLQWKEYFRSLSRADEAAVLAMDDPVPLFFDVPTSFYRFGKRAFLSFTS